VPFGEYLPLQDWWKNSGFVQLTRVQGGFIPGTRRRIMDNTERATALPLICYEAIFPGGPLRARRAPGLDHQPDQMMAGLDIRPAPTSIYSSAAARDRGRPADRSARQHRHFSRYRSLGTYCRTARPCIEGVLDANLPAALRRRFMRALQIFPQP